jgi:hypothetical protein
MRSSHAAGSVDVVFDEANLLPDAGLVPVMALAERIGLADLVTGRVTVTGANSAGANAAAKAMTLVAGMVAGADSISDVDRLRLGAMGVVFDGVRAPSTLGSFLRSFTHGHVRQLDSVHRQVLVALAASSALLPGADRLAFVDLDSTHRQVYGYQKQGARVGRLKGKRTLHPLLAALSTPLSAPVVAGVRMRAGRSADVRGAAAFLAEVLGTARAAGATGTIIVRGDSKFYTAEVVAAAHRAGAFVSLTTGSNPSVNAAIARIDDSAWTPIHYPDAFVDEDTGELVSDAEVAQIAYTAFTSRPRREQVHGRLIVRRVRRLNRPGEEAQGTLFDTWRHHAVFVTGPFEMLQAEEQHRDHAIVEQVIRDGKGSALAHLPSGSFNANAAWAVLWAIAHNLTRAAGVLAGKPCARATTATLRTRLINVPARIARSARRLTLHLPQHWPWEQALTSLHAAVMRTPSVTPA